MARLFASLKQAAGSDKIAYPKHNPLSKSGKKVMAGMKEQYGKKGESVFYATMTKNKMKSKWENKK